MNKYIFLLLFLCSIVSMNAQEYKISFGYDSAGNQTLRDRVCVNCGTAKAIDSTLVTNLDEELDREQDLLKDEIEEIGETNLVAYPNPVTDILNIEWQATSKTVNQISVFSMSSVNVLNKPIKPDQHAINLDFSGLPSGMYVVLIMYSDDTKQSFRVLKN